MTAPLEEALRLICSAQRDAAAMQALLAAPGVAIAVARFQAQRTALDRQQ